MSNGILNYQLGRLLSLQKSAQIFLNYMYVEKMYVFWNSSLMALRAIFLVT